LGGYMRRRMVWAVALAGLMSIRNMTMAQEREKSPQSGALRVVIAGMVHGHVDGFLAGAMKRKDIEIVGVAEPDRGLFEMYAKKYGLDAKLYHADLAEAIEKTKPQAVLAYTNTLEHRKVVEICAKYPGAMRAGAKGLRPLAVMMEKPLAVSAGDAHAIAEVAAKASMPVLVNYFATWEPSRQAALDVVNKNEIGDVRKVVTHDGHQGPKEVGVGPEFLGWLTDPKLNGGGALYDFGCYGADFMTWLMNGKRPLTVTAVTLQIRPDVYLKVDDDATILLTYPKVEAILLASWNWPFGRSDVEVYGKTGTVFTRGRDEIEEQQAGEAEAKKMKAPPLVEPQNDPLSYLRAVVLEGLKPDGRSSLEVNVVVAEILDAARESAKTGKTVRIKEGAK